MHLKRGLGRVRVGLGQISGSGLTRLLNSTVKKIFLISLIELQLIASSLDQIFDYLLITLIMTKAAVKKLFNVE